MTQRKWNPKVKEVRELDLKKIKSIAYDNNLVQIEFEGDKILVFEREQVPVIKGETF